MLRASQCLAHKKVPQSQISAIYMKRKGAFSKSQASKVFLCRQTRQEIHSKPVFSQQASVQGEGRGSGSTAFAVSQHRVHEHSCSPTAQHRARRLCAAGEAPSDSAGAPEERVFRTLAASPRRKQSLGRCGPRCPHLEKGVNTQKLPSHSCCAGATCAQALSPRTAPAPAALPQGARPGG